MSDFPIDPEVRVRAHPEQVLRGTSDAIAFLRDKAGRTPGGPWADTLRKFEEVGDEWSAIEAVVELELLLEREGLLIEEKRLEPPSQSRAF